ncbi:MAG TPA: hypothetical protein VGC15_06650 [Acetobacteraceae bacterium]
MTNPPPGPAARHDMSLLEPMPDGNSLTQDELDGIAACLGPRWCMMPHQDPAGGMMAMVMAGDDDPALPTWVVHREGALLRLDLCEGDSYVRQGACPALPQLLASLRAALAAAGR